MLDAIELTKASVRDGFVLSVSMRGAKQAVADRARRKEAEAVQNDKILRYAAVDQMAALFTQNS